MRKFCFSPFSFHNYNNYLQRHKGYIKLLTIAANILSHLIHSKTRKKLSKLIIKEVNVKM